MNSVPPPCRLDCRTRFFRQLLIVSLGLSPLTLAGCAAVPYAISAAQTAAVNKASDYFEGDTPPGQSVDSAKIAAEDQAPYQLVAEKKYDQALPLLRDRADRGDTKAQEQLGRLYLNGRGVPEDPYKAFAWMRQAAEGGRPAAQHTLARFYLNGIGVARDDGQAALWAQKAAAGGNADGIDLLATLYRQGRGVGQDYGRALELYRQADLAGNRTAPAHIGALYKNGQGVSKDYLQAMDWYSKAAERGHADSWLQLAALYATCPDPQSADGRRAISYALKATEKKPDYYAAWAVLAAAYARNGDFAKAIEIAGKSDGLLAADPHLEATAREAAQAGAAIRQAALKENRPISEQELALPEE